MTSILRKQVVNSLSWTATFNILKQIIQFINFSILARLLTPNDFGLLSMVAVFSNFMSMFGELGFTSALIQRHDVEERHFSSAFWLNMASSSAVTLVLCLISPLIAKLYDQPDLQQLTIALSINFPILALGIVHKAILSRQMAFKKLGFLNLTTFIFAGIISIVLAWQGYGVFSLVYQTLLSNLFFSIAIWLTTGWYPFLIFDKKSVSELWNFSAGLLGFNSFNYWARNADNFLVGKFIGEYELGLYGQAYRIMLLPINQISSVLGGVLFPAMSKIQDKPEAVKDIYLTSLNYIAFISFPIMLGLCITASDFIEVFYGSEWLGMTKVLQILSLTGFFQSIVTTVGWLYQSQGRTDVMFKWGIFSGWLVLMSFCVGVYWGSIEALSWCYLGITLILLYWNFSIPGSFINLSFSEVLKSLSKVFWCTLGMGCGSILLQIILPNSLHAFWRLSLQVFCGISLYFIFASIFKPTPYIKIKLTFMNWLKLENNY